MKIVMIVWLILLTLVIAPLVAYQHNHNKKVEASFNRLASEVGKVVNQQGAAIGALQKHHEKKGWFGK